MLVACLRACNLCTLKKKKMLTRQGTPAGGIMLCMVVCGRVYGCGHVSCLQYSRRPRRWQPRGVVVCFAVVAPHSDRVSFFFPEYKSYKPGGKPLTCTPQNVA